MTISLDAFSKITISLDAFFNVQADHLVFGFLAACNALRDNLAIHPGPPPLRCTERYSSQCKNNCFTEMRSGSEEGSYVRLTDGCIAQL